MCQTSARFDVIIWITIILTGLGDLKIFFKKIQLKNQNSAQAQAQDKQNSLKKKCVLMKKTHAHADFL